MRESIRRECLFILMHARVDYYVDVCCGGIKPHCHLPIICAVLSIRPQRLQVRMALMVYIFSLNEYVYAPVSNQRRVLCVQFAFYVFI